MLNINNYLFEQPLTIKDAGLSCWGLGKRDGRTYFVKEFLWPTYPVDDALFSERRKESLISLCKAFEEKKRKLYLAIHEASDGNLMVIRQFFREDAKYYISTDAVTEPQISLESLSRFSFTERLRICCSIAHSIASLHQKGVVHADIKPSNVLLFERNHHIQAKIIDFDCSFFETASPKPDEPGEKLGMDLVYSSPEAYLYIDEETPALTCKMDVFSSGLLFHQYLTGGMPSFNSTKSCRYAGEAVLENQSLRINRNIGTPIYRLLEGMLQKNPWDRPDMATVFQILHHLFLARAERVMPQFREHNATTQIVSHDEQFFKQLKYL